MAQTPLPHPAYMAGPAHSHFSPASRLSSIILPPAPRSQYHQEVSMTLCDPCYLTCHTNHQYA